MEYLFYLFPTKENQEWETYAELYDSIGTGDIDYHNGTGVDIK